MERPLLTIGMATYDDFNGMWATIQALRLCHADIMPQCELVVIDNNPTSSHGTNCRDFINSWVKGDVARARYLAFPEPVGTSASRDRVFRMAMGEYVLVMDSHVFIVPGALKRLLAYFEDHSDTMDLLSGPLLYDDLSGISTHFADEWRAEMWGTWATDPAGESPDADPFEIPANGLGVFACRKKAWLGFNKHFRGFGGEEFYIHHKFRQSGAKCICLPWLRWVHRFGRPDGVPYPLTRMNKVRNYVIGHTELGIDKTRLYEHFVKQGLTSQEEWDALTAEAQQLQDEDVAKAQTMPSTPEKAAHLAKAVAAHVLDGCKKVSQEIYASRLMQCFSCGDILDNDCSLCGCPVTKKAAWRSEQCPVGRWKQADCPQHSEVA